MKAKKLDGTCAVTVIYGFSDKPDVGPEGELASVVDDIRNDGAPVVLFTDVVGEADCEAETNRGLRLSKYIRSHDLGEVYESEPVYNGSSGNDIVVYIWVVNEDTLYNWEAPEKAEAPKKFKKTPKSCKRGAEN